jgi:hypothetical protein
MTPGITVRGMGIDLQKQGTGRKSQKQPAPRVGNNPYGKPQ